MTGQANTAEDAGTGELRIWVQEAARHNHHLDLVQGGVPLGHHTRLFIGAFSFAVLLEAFMKANPDAAHEALTHIRDMLESGINAEMWLGEQLARLGVDSDQLKPLTCCLPTAGAEAG